MIVAHTVAIRTRGPKERSAICYYYLNIRSYLLSTVDDCVFLTRTIILIENTERQRYNFTDTAFNACLYYLKENSHD